MAKVVTIKQTLSGDVDPKGGSVRFNQDEGDKNPAITSLYILRKRARKEGIEDLDDAVEVRCTFEIVMKDGKKKKKRERDEDEDE